MQGRQLLFPKKVIKNSPLCRIGTTLLHPPAIANPLLRKQASRSSARLCRLMQHWRH
ncbi:hypothetical protein [Sphingobacterium luzhongxinii]|nr:hypothetical protein [Sphingobacterium sp. xlx-73]